MFFFWYSVSVYISVSAQNLTPAIFACSKSAQARYACFKKWREGELERTKEMEVIRRSARDTKEEFLLISLMHSKRQCENYLLEKIQQIKYSRFRNISQIEKILPYLWLYG